MEDDIFCCCLTSEVEEAETSLAIDSNFALAALVVSFLCSALLKNLPTSAFSLSFVTQRSPWGRGKGRWGGGRPGGRGSQAGGERRAGAGGDRGGGEAGQCHGIAASLAPWDSTLSIRAACKGEKRLMLLDCV